MSDNNGMSGLGMVSAEGGTLSRGETAQPKQAAPGRFPEGPCQNMANGMGASGALGGTQLGSGVQCEQNGSEGTGVQRPRIEDTCGSPDCQGPKACGAGGCEVLHPNGCSADRTLDGWRCRWHELDGSDTTADLAADACEGIAAEDRRLVSFAALDAARSWARDWLDVYGQPTQLWGLLLHFAALVAMRPGERRWLDERHSFRLFEGEPGGMLTEGCGGWVLTALVMPFGTSAFGRPLPEGEVSELEAAVRGAIQRVEALGAEAELFRHAAGLIRGDGFSDRWTAGCDCRDLAGVPCEPHPDAYRWSLAGAMRQAAAERGGVVSAAAWRRLGAICLPEYYQGQSIATGETIEALRVWHDNTVGLTVRQVLEVLTRAALAADAEAESETL